MKYAALMLLAACTAPEPGEHVTEPPLVLVCDEDDAGLPDTCYLVEVIEA